MIISKFPQYFENKYYENNKNTSFCSKTTKITKEQLKPLIQQGLSIPEICKKIGIESKYVCKNILKRHGLTTKSQDARQAAKKISIEKFKELVNSGTSRSQILTELDISLGIYNRLYRELGLESINSKQKKFIDSITKESFLALLNSGKSVPEIRKELNNISRETYDALLKKFKIETIHKKRLNNASKITKEQLQSMLDAGKTSEEIFKELNIAHSTLTRYLNLYGLETNYSQNFKNVENITKENFVKIYNEKKNVKEIIETFGISRSTYQKLLIKFGLTTKFQENRNKIKSITKELLQTLVDLGFSAKEIYTNLNISNKTFYNLLKYHKIKYNYQHHDKEIFISKDRLREISMSGKSLEEITQELGIYASTYEIKAKAAGVNTKLRKSIDKINSISPNELETLIYKGLSVKDICKKLGITDSMYKQLIEKYYINTQSRNTHKHISNISKENILKLKTQGKTIKEICEELKISYTTYYKIMDYGSEI